MAEAAEWTFPSSFKASFARWWHADERAQHCEDLLLRRGLKDIPFESLNTKGEVTTITPPDAAAPGETRTAKLRHVQLGGRKDRFLNVLEVGRGERTDAEHNLIVLHGYAGGLAYYFQSLRALSSVANTRVFALDWLGWGKSGRPSWPRISPKGKGGEAIRSRVNQAEDFFVDSLEEFRQKEGLKKLTLIGHSLGGYLASAYALKHPDRVNRLILVSPVGVPEAPYDLPDAGAGDIVADAAAAEMHSQVEAVASEGSAKQKEKAPTGFWTRLWELNVSPFGILRASTFLSPKLVSRYASWRYSSFPSDVQKELFDYLYLISTARGSGEYALAHILAPRAYARWPLMQRLKNSNLPITLLYGDHDWMQPEHGHDFVKMLKSKPDSPETALQKKRARVTINPHSGHWVFLENPDGFDRIIKREIQELVHDQSPS